jgi:hypothetical protein
MGVSTKFSGNLFRVKQLFFDRRAVTDAVQKATLQKLNYIGGLIRKTAVNSIRSSKSVSSPGQPPRSHTGLLKQFIYYSYDPAANSVVIGPVKLAGAKGQDVPHNLECGGTTTLDSKWSLRSKQTTIKPRPFMVPALETNQEKISKIWANILK